MSWTFNILNIIRAPGVGLSLPSGIIHVHNNMIQRFSSLKQLGQSKSIFIGCISMKGNQCDYR